MAEVSVRIETEGATLVLTLDRPHKLNAIDQKTSEELSRALSDAETDPSIKVVVVTGAGGEVFCSGADLTCLADRDYPSMQFGRFARHQSSKPIIVAANGSAYGGGVEIMLSGDIVIVEEGCEFAFPELKVGIFPAAGGALKLPRYIPQAAAMDLLLTGEAVGAERFYHLGLASRLVCRGKACEEAMRIAELVGSLPVESVKVVKEIASISTGAIPAEQWSLNGLYADALRFSNESTRGPMVRNWARTEGSSE